MAIITGEIEYIELGKVRAHYEMYIPDDELEWFNQLPKNEQIDQIQEDGEILIDDFGIDEIGDIYEINID